MHKITEIQHIEVYPLLQNFNQSNYPLLLIKMMKEALG